MSKELINPKSLSNQLYKFKTHVLKTRGFCLTETDSPYLAPHPLRGTVNEPKNVSLVCAFLANLKGIELQSFASIVMENAKRLFTKL